MGEPAAPVEHAQPAPVLRRESGDVGERDERVVEHRILGPDLRADVHLVRDPKGPIAVDGACEGRPLRSIGVGDGVHVPTADPLVLVLARPTLWNPFPLGPLAAKTGSGCPRADNDPRGTTRRRAVQTFGFSPEPILPVLAALGVTFAAAAARAHRPTWPSAAPGCCTVTNLVDAYLERANTQARRYPQARRRGTRAVPRR